MFGNMYTTYYCKSLLKTIYISIHIYVSHTHIFKLTYGHEVIMFPQRAVYYLKNYCSVSHGNLPSCCCLNDYKYY